MRKFLLATLSYVVFTMALAVVWNLLFFPDIYIQLTQHANRAAPVIPLGMFTMLIEAPALSALFYLLYNNDHCLRHSA